MFDANALGPLVELADDFALEVTVDLASEKAHHIPAGETGDGVVDQHRVDALQSRRALEDDVAGPLALIDRPIGGGRKVPEDLIVQG